MTLKPESIQRLASISVIAWMALIFVLSAQERMPTTAGMPPDIAAIAGHFVAYSVLATLIRIAIGGLRSDRRSDVLAVALATIYGLTDEFHQSFVPGRDPSAFDIGIDLLGATIGVISINLAMIASRRIQDER